MIDSPHSMSSQSTITIQQRRTTTTTKTLKVSYSKLTLNVSYFQLSLSYSEVTLTVTYWQLFLLRRLPELRSGKTANVNEESN